MASGRGRTRRRRPDEIGWKTNGFDQVEQPRFPPGVAAGLLEGGVEQVEGMGQRAMTEVGPRGLDEVGPVAVEEDVPVVEAGGSATAEGRAPEDRRGTARAAAPGECSARVGRTCSPPLRAAGRMEAHTEAWKAGPATGCPRTHSGVPDDGGRNSSCLMPQELATDTQSAGRSGSAPRWPGTAHTPRHVHWRPMTDIRRRAFRLFPLLLALLPYCVECAS